MLATAVPLNVAAARPSLVSASRRCVAPAARSGDSAAVVTEAELLAFPTFVMSPHLHLSFVSYHIPLAASPTFTYTARPFATSPVLA